jgi:hypothetical protein
MDFIIVLLKVQGWDCIYVVVEKLTNYAHLLSIPSEYNASQVEDLFFKEAFKLHGLPRNIVSDRDSVFHNIVW